MQKINLTRGGFALVDDEDYEALNKHKWRMVTYFGIDYALRTETVDGEHRTILRHRHIMEAGNGKNVDHKNKNGLDNRRENLRFGTVAQSQYNRRINKNNTTGYKGVCWSPAKGKYFAQIYKNQERKWLGVFDSPIDAAKAYNTAALKYFEEFARLNEIPKEM